MPGSSCTHTAPAGEAALSEPSRTDQSWLPLRERRVRRPAEAAAGRGRVQGERPGGQVGDDRDRVGADPHRGRVVAGERCGCAEQGAGAGGNSGCAGWRRPASPTPGRPGRAPADSTASATPPSAATSCSASSTERSATAAGDAVAAVASATMRPAASDSSRRTSAPTGSPAGASPRAARAATPKTCAPCATTRAAAMAVEPAPRGTVTSTASARSACSRDRPGARSGSGPPASQPPRAPMRVDTRTARSVAGAEAAGAEVDAAEVDRDVALDHEAVGRAGRQSGVRRPTRTPDRAGHVAERGATAGPGGEAGRDRRR